MVANSTSGALPAVVTIQDLPAGTSLTGTELLEAVQTSGGVASSVQITVAQIMTSTLGGLPAGGGTGQVLNKSSASNYSTQWSNIASLVTASSGITVAGSTTVQVSISTVAGLSVLGVVGTSNAVPAAIVGTADQVLTINHAGTGVVFGPVNLAATAAVTGALGVPQGGHGTSTLTAFGIVFGNGTSTVGITAAGGTGTFLSSPGPLASPIFTTVAPNVVAGGGLSGGTTAGTGTIAAMNVVNLAGRVGGFDVWQRLLGNSSATALAQAAATTAYQNDGWYLITGANQSATVGQVAGIATGSLYAANVQRNNAQTGTTVMRYAAPLDSDELAGMQGNFVAFSFTAKAGANWSPASGTLNYAVYVGTGAVGKRGATAFTGETTPISASANLITTPTRYSAVSTTIVPTTTTQVEVQFNWTPATTAGADDSVTVDDLQLEVVAGSSSLASPFVKADLASQNVKAARFLRVIGGTTFARYGAGRTTLATNGELILSLVYPMRTAPNIIVNNVSNWNVNDASVAANAIALASVLASVDTVNVNLTLGTANGTATAFRAAFFTPSNANATMFFTAEI